MKINRLAYFNMRALFMGIGISRLLNISYEFTFISILLGTLFGSIFLFFYKKNSNNKITSIIVNSILIMISLLVLINMVSSHYLTGVPKLIIGLPILLLLLYMSNKKYKVLVRLSNILFILNIFIFILSIISLIPDIEFFTYNFNNTTIIKIIISSLYYMLLSLVPVLGVKNNDYLIRTYLLSSFTLCIWFLITYSILGSELIKVLRYPEYVILKNVKLGNGIENIENIISFVWMIDIIILMFNCINNLSDCYVDKRYIYLNVIIIFIITSIININYLFLNYIYNNIFIVLSILFLLNILQNKKNHS